MSVDSSLYTDKADILRRATAFIDKKVNAAVMDEVIRVQVSLSTEYMSVPYNAKEAELIDRLNKLNDIKATLDQARYVGTDTQIRDKFRRIQNDAIILLDESRRLHLEAARKLMGEAELMRRLNHHVSVI
jgi:hypothetical protein